MQSMQPDPPDKQRKMGIKLHSSTWDEFSITGVLGHSAIQTYLPVKCCNTGCVNDAASVSISIWFILAHHPCCQSYYIKAACNIYLESIEEKIE